MTQQADTGTVPPWPVIRQYAEHAEGLGLHSLWIFDHLYSGHGDVTPEAIHEAWTLQSALAAATSRVELGQLVNCVTFRSPAVLAKMAVTADDISGSRLLLGLGAGWYDREYHDFGFRTDYRGTRFAEAMDIITPLLAGETVTYQGRFHQVENATLLPAPSRHIPVLIAGAGPRMRSLAAQHADAWNTAWYAEPDERFEARMADMRASLDEAGRDHASMRWTVGMSPKADSDGAYTAALDAFAEKGVDDLIVAVTGTDLGALDRLAKAAAAYL